jgi:RNA polymerase sigma-70 factor, ECF subfamily
VDWWRRSGRSEALHEPLDDVDENLLVASGDDTEARRDLSTLLETLPQAQREAIALTKLQGLSVAEASRHTGASESAIKVQVHRGLKRLAQMMQRGVARP